MDEVLVKLARIGLASLISDNLADEEIKKIARGPSIGLLASLAAIAAMVSGRFGSGASTTTLPPYSTVKPEVPLQQKPPELMSGDQKPLWATG